MARGSISGRRHGIAFVTVPAKGGLSAHFVPNWIDLMTILHKIVTQLALAASVVSLYSPVASAQAVTYVYGAQGGYVAQPYAVATQTEVPAWQGQVAGPACGGCQGARVVYGMPQGSASGPAAPMGAYGPGQVVVILPCQTCGPAVPQEVRFTADTGGGVGGEPGGYYGGGGGGGSETGISGYGNVSGWVGSHSGGSNGVNVNVSNTVSANARAYSGGVGGHGGHGGGHGCGCAKPPPPPPCNCRHH